MAQYIYLIAAMLGLMTITMTSQRGIDRTRQTEMSNEVSTQLTNAAAEVMERVGRAYYDKKIYDERNNTFIGGNPANGIAYCGRVPAGQEATRLTAPGSFVTCADYATCNTIEGFHDLNAGGLPGNPDLVLTRGGFTINIEIRVSYVDPANYATASGTPTFAKQVAVTAHTPDVYLGEDPGVFANQLKLTLTRVFPYTCPTSPSLLPFPGGGQTCTDIGAQNVTCANDAGA